MGDRIHPVVVTADGTKSAVMVMVGLRGRLAAIVRLGAANFSRHSDRGAGFSARKNDASIRGEHKGQSLQEKQASDDARKERAGYPLRFWRKSHHFFIFDVDKRAVNIKNREHE